MTAVLPQKGKDLSLLLSADWWMGRKPAMVRSEEAKRIRPGVTLLIPAYNEGAFIAEVVQSALAQTYPIDEIIVIADNCSDNTAEIARSLGVTVIENPPDPLTGRSSKPRAQNAALPYVRTELVATLDADTTLKEDALERMIPYFNDEKTFGVSGYIVAKNIVEYLEREKEIRAVSEGLSESWKLLRRQGRPEWRDARRSWKRYVRENSLTYWELGRLLEYLYQYAVVKPGQNHTNSIFVVSGCMAAFKTEILRELGGFDPTIFNEDMLLTWLARKRGYRNYTELESMCYPLEPANFATYVRQDDRWYRGTYQCLKRFRFNLFFFGVIPALFNYFQLIAGALGLFFWPVTFWLWAASLGAGNFASLALGIAGSAAVYAIFVWWPAAHEARKRGLSSLTWQAIPANLVTQLVNQAVNIWAILMELVLGRPLKGWHKGHASVARFSTSPSASKAA